MTGSPGDARQSKRVSIDLGTTLKLQGGRLLQSRTRDLSRTGICLITSEPLPGGQTLALDLVLATSDNTVSEPLTLPARVVWCTAIGGSFQIGAIFDNLTRDQDGILEMFMHYLDGTLAPVGAARSDDDDPVTPPADCKDDPFGK